MTDDIYWQEGEIDRADRERLAGHRGACVWLTGLSGSGKSSIAQVLETRLYRREVRTFILDGDNVRHGLNSDLGFSAEDRNENIRRVGEVANLFVDSAAIVLAAFISPYRDVRADVRQTVGDDRFVEVHVDCPVEVCEERDPKGLYERARAGEIENFTGISAPYEAPEDPEIRIDTAEEPDAGASAEAIEAYLDDEGFLDP
ncbi:MAG: adenylyl-sulfate kinase [Bradymonadaceae bacterium]